MKHISRNSHSCFWIIIVCTLVMSCEKMLDVKPNKSIYDKDDVFGSDATATTAIVGMYAEMYSDASSFASGTSSGIAILTGLSSDELDMFVIDANKSTFETHQLTAANPSVLNLWSSLYKTIYAANSAIEGLEESSGVTPSVKNQLLGEAYFIRGFCYFYLTNLFDKAPLVLGTAYEENALKDRADSAAIYNQIIADLEKAESMIGDNYVTTERVRPNKATVYALMARVNLYRKNWEAAIEYSTRVIDDGRYLFQPLAQTFLNTSSEAIWQLVPVGQYQNTNEGSIFVLQFAPIYSADAFALQTDLIEAFESDDQRLFSWVGLYSDGGVDYYYPYKYKIFYGGSATDPVTPLTEYSMVFRLAEQYLIRAEARAMQGDFEGAVDDINFIRLNHGGLSTPLAAPSDEDEALDIILHERQVELFTEWGHRWFDVKRTGRANNVFAIKPNWTSNAQLYPVPEQEITRNQNLQPQNNGY